MTSRGQGLQVHEPFPPNEEAALLKPNTDFTRQTAQGIFSGGSKMCKHVLNAQVAVRSPCCKKWFDCAECHAESESHELKPTLEMVFACKKCKKCFRKDVQDFDDSDEYCPHCDNHFVLEAVEPKARLEIESEDVRKDARMLKDDRARGEEQQTLWDIKGLSEKMG